MNNTQTTKFSINSQAQNVGASDDLNQHPLEYRNQNSIGPSRGTVNQSAIDGYKFDDNPNFPRNERDTTPQIHMKLDQDKRESSPIYVQVNS